jgi:N-acetyl-1-D-myo-inositol-2-amino-2-deoxy-alpha-D-glucopyranoside deacetylase
VTSAPDERILLVHAHPDDETIQNGATMAKYVAEGRGVTLVTCTAGELGEILVPELEHLAADKEDGLGEHRRGELELAMKELGVTDHRFLGGFGTYRDSGMAWHEEGYAIPADPETTTGHENTFWHADLREAADHLVSVIREVRPQVLVTYDQFGNYGHPDHIQAHRVATYAAALAAVPSYKLDLGEPWDIPKIYWSAMSETRFRTMLRRMREAGDTETFEGMDPDGDFGPWVTPDAMISARIDGTDLLATKLAALSQHRSQVEQDGPFFRGSENGQSMFGEEFYRLAKGEQGPTDAQGWESDLFAGL